MSIFTKNLVSSALATFGAVVLIQVATAETIETAATSGSTSTLKSLTGLKAENLGAAYFGWFFMDGKSANQGKADDSFSIQNFGLTYKTESKWTVGAYYASTLSWDQKGASEYEVENPYLEFNRFGWINFWNGASLSVIGQIYFPVTESWKQNGTSELFGFFWINKPLAGKWEMEYHGHPRYSHHNRFKTKSISDNGEITEKGLPGALYLQELKARYIVNQNLKAFQLVGLQTEWYHRGADSESFKEIFEVESGLEWVATKNLWVQGSVRQNISERPYFKNFKLYTEDQTEYHLRLSASM